jgi:hypothetical protein
MGSGHERPEAPARSALVAIGVSPLVLATCVTLPTPQEDNDAVSVENGRPPACHLRKRAASGRSIPRRC